MLLRDLSIQRILVSTGVMELIPCGHQGTAVQSLNLPDLPRKQSLENAAPDMKISVKTSGNWK